MTNEAHNANRVLASIPAKDYKRMQAHLEPHAFLAHMLGLRREGVTAAATALKQRKLINYSRGKIQILEVRGLKKSSCTCYQTVKTVFDRAQD